MAGPISLQIGQTIVFGAAHTYQDRHYRPCHGPHNNWDAVCSHWHSPKWMAWWFYPLAIFLAEACSTDVELKIEALAHHVAHALNITRPLLTLLLDEVTQMWKVILQNRMVLDILTTAHGVTGALQHAGCCVYIPDHQQ